LHFDLVKEAPAQILAGFERRNEGVLGTGGMLAGVPIVRIIATTYVTAVAAESQMHPGIARC
jgi:hypothetical protein